MFELDEQTQMVATMVRQWSQSQLAPKIPVLETGADQPLDLMKKLAKTFGCDAMRGASVKKRIAKLRSGEVDDGDRQLAKGIGSPMMMHIVVKELSRVSPGFEKGFGE